MPVERTDSERLAVIESTVVDLKHRLIGNGQPGEISILHTRISKVDSRVDGLDNWKYWLTGVGVGVGMVAGYFLKGLM